MSTIIRSAILAVVVAAGASSAIAQSATRYDNSRYGYDSRQQSDRSFWDQQQRNGQ